MVAQSLRWTPQQVWEAYPPRYIERYYLLAQRDRARENIFRMRLAGCENIDEPAWLEDDTPTSSAAVARLPGAQVRDTPQGRVVRINPAV